MAHWLMKSEPDVFSIDDLERDKTASWEGVRNYQARNIIRDEMKAGDLAFFYHSNIGAPGIVGVMRIQKEAYPDDTAFDPNSEYHDPKSDRESPRWYQVDVAFEEKFKETIPLAWLKEQPLLADCPLVKRGNRLSVMPVTRKQWRFIMQHARRGERRLPQ